MFSLVVDTGNAVVVEDIHKAYGELKAVDGVSLSVAEGEFFGILGPNGAGKTTTLEIIEGLREPDSGTVQLLGESPGPRRVGLAPRLRGARPAPVPGESQWPGRVALLPRIGVQLEASSFFEKLTAREQLETFASLYGVGAGKGHDTLELGGRAGK